MKVGSKEGGGRVVGIEYLLRKLLLFTALLFGVFLLHAWLEVDPPEARHLIYEGNYLFVSP